jgi:hypothetical protein
VAAANNGAAAMSTIFAAIDTNLLAFAAAVLVGFLCMGAVTLAIGAWEEMHR